MPQGRSDRLREEVTLIILTAVMYGGTMFLAQAG
jgi:hypothetical protein